MTIRERMLALEAKLRDDRQAKTGAERDAHHVGRHIAIKDGRASHATVAKTAGDRWKGMGDSDKDHTQRNIYRGARNEFLRQASDKKAGSAERKALVRKAKAMHSQVRAWGFSKDSPRQKVTKKSL